MSHAQLIGTQRGTGTWLGAGAWLRDNRTETIGVIVDVREHDAIMSSRICIRWRPNRYENISVMAALEKFKCGQWVLDNGA